MTTIDWPALAPHTIRMFLNFGGLFEPAVFDGTAPVGRLIQSIVPGRFDRSGRTGYFLPDHGRPDGPGTPNILLLPTGAAGLRSAPANLPGEAAHTTGAVAGDLDGDGADDLVVFHPYAQDGLGMELYRNDGDGHFQVDHRAFPSWVSKPQAEDHRFACGTLVHRTGRAAPDLMVFGWGETRGRVLLNDGKGHFSDGAPLPAAPRNSGPVPGGCAVQAGNDVIVGFTPGVVQYLANNGDGTFRDETASHLAPLPASKGDLHRIEFQRDALSQRDTLVLTRAGESPLIRRRGAGGLFIDVMPVNGPAWPWVTSRRRRSARRRPSRPDLRAGKPAPDSGPLRSPLNQSTASDVTGVRRRRAAAIDRKRVST